MGTTYWTLTRASSKKLPVRLPNSSPKSLPRSAHGLLAVSFPRLISGFCPVFHSPEHFLAKWLIYMTMVLANSAILGHYFHSPELAPLYSIETPGIDRFLQFPSVFLLILFLVSTFQSPSVIPLVHISA